jgi:hypothetical protein
MSECRLHLSLRDSRDRSAEVHIMFSYVCSAMSPHNDIAMQMPCRFFHSAWQFYTSLFLNVFSDNYGAPEEIRTHDPQIRSLRDECRY